MTSIHTDIVSVPTERAQRRSLPHPARFYRRFNRRLDQLSVPAAVNESLIAGLREQLDAGGDPRSGVYWLLTARLAEMALLCAGHYADCGETGAAGDLLLNPRRVLVYLRGAPGPILKERHRPLSDQFNPGGLSLPDFAAWFRDNAMTHIAEPALLPAFRSRLARCARMAAYRERFQARLTRVADVMRFGFTARGPQTGRPHRLTCGFDTAEYHRLGRHVTRSCSNPAFHSPYLAAPLVRQDMRYTVAESSRCGALRAAP